MIMPESGLRDHLDHLWDMVGVVFTDILRFTHCGENGQGTCFKAIMEGIGSLTTPVSGLAAYLDHLWDMVGSCQFQTMLYDLRIVVKMAQKQASDPFGSYWKDNYANEWSRSLFRSFMGHDECLPFSTDIVWFMYCGGNGPETSFKAILEVIGSLTMVS